jgi:hypothetical protein
MLTVRCRLTPRCGARGGRAFVLMNVLNFEESLLCTEQALHYAKGDPAPVQLMSARLHATKDYRSYCVDASEPGSAAARRRPNAISPDGHLLTMTVHTSSRCCSMSNGWTRG